MDKRQRYREYLQSDDWKQKRTRKVQSASGCCSICHSPDRIDVHHLEYRNWFDVQSSDLRLLCRRCHDAAHVLMRAGVILFAPSMSHHARYAITKHHVTAHLQRQEQAKMLQPVTNTAFRITREWLQTNRSPRGGWSRAALSVLAVSWPPEKGWLSKQVGRCIPDAVRHAFEAAAREVAC